MKDKIEALIKKHKLTDRELDRVLTALANEAPKSMQTFKDYFSRKDRFGVISDPHIGSNMFDEPFWKQMIKVMKKEEVPRVYCCGDILEGMSGRDGQIYEMDEIGYENQMDKAERLFKMFGDIPVFGIDGNHDAWFQKKNNAGVVVGKELEMRVKGYHHLGQDEAEVEIRPNVKMRLFHPGDGTAYAISYKMQKAMESFTGGEKPDILLEGHYHKALYMFNRNIHGIEAGTMCGQTRWMRSKKIPAHKGFWIVDLELGKGGIGKFAPAFYSGYK